MTALTKKIAKFRAMTGILAEALAGKAERWRSADRLGAG
jgi:hypothetical protein